MLRLRSVAADLGNEFTAERIAEVAVDHAVQAVGARGGAFYVIEPDRRHARITCWRGLSAAILEQFGRVGLNGSALANAMQKGEPILLRSVRDFSARCPNSIAALEDLAEGPCPVALLPVNIEGTTLGCISLHCASEHDFTEHERSFLSLLALHCAEALRRASVIEQERGYHQRIRILADASDLLARTLDYEPTLRTIVAMTMPALADFCLLDVIEESETRRISRSHQDPETQELLQDTRWIPFGRDSSGPDFQPYLDEARLLGVSGGVEQLELLRRLRLCSLISVPLVAHGERLGTLTLCHGRSGRHHTPADLAIAEELALRAAQAVRHARLYLTSQRATLRAEEAARQAEEASRLKDEFLTTVSHELRTPLSAILGWSMLLRRERNTTAAALDKGLEAIERNARAQQRIIEDILDVSRMVCGKFRIKSAPVHLEAIADDVIDTLRSAADARRIQLVLSAPGAPHCLHGDADRLRQILWNLVSNAVKFTPGGGTVKLEIARTDQVMSVVVRDTGSGIDPQFLPHVFEHFRQADGTTTRTHGGLGLGLAMVRHLTEMHGGSVSAASEGAGKGATFTVLLPVGSDGGISLRA